MKPETGPLRAGAYNQEVVRRALVILLPLVAAGLLGTIAGSAATGLVRVPRVSELETYRPDIITEIRANDGSTIARYAIERRILISRAEIPTLVRNAIVATEDKNFYRHGGVDLARTVAAVASDLRHQRYAQGGSTLTQQLARRISSPRAKRSPGKSTRRSSPSKSSGATRRTRS